MSRKGSSPFLFQNLLGKAITYSDDEYAIIRALLPLIGGEWEGKIKSGCPVRRIDRNKIVTEIKNKLLKLQGRYCIYCGIHEKHCGRLQREHIAPKGSTHYPEFMFEPLNLALACHHCNVELKGEYNTISKYSKNYSKSKFNIVHPYFDNFERHIILAANNGKALIRSVPRSRKGLNHIKIFELDSVAKTEKRSGLLIVDTIKIAHKYDKLLNDALSCKFTSF